MLHFNRQTSTKNIDKKCRHDIMILYYKENDSVVYAVIREDMVDNGKR